MQTTIAETSSPAVQVDLDDIFTFDSDWPGSWNTLFTNSSGLFFLGDCGDTEPQGGQVTASEALRWYAQSADYSTDGAYGDIRDLCEAAAQEIDDLRKILALRRV